MKLPPDWSEFIDLLISRRVRFVIVGAHALAVHGRPRATQDIDLFVEPTLANARRLGAALREFGFEALSEEADKFAEPNRMAVLGRPPLRIDLITSIDGVSFAEAWKGRTRAKFGGRTVGFLGRSELIRNKRAAGRPQDLADLALLEEAGEDIARPPRNKRRR